MDVFLNQDASKETSAQVLAPLRSVCVALLIIDTIVFVLRFVSVLFARNKKLKLTWDDWFLVPAYVLLVAMIGAGLATYHLLSQFSGHPDTFIVDPHYFVPTMKAVFALTQLVTPAFAFTRFSVLSLYIRIFFRPYVRITSYILIGFVALQVFVYNITSAVQCQPTNFFWNHVYYLQSGGGGKCVDLNGFYRSFMGPEMFVDLLIIILPLPEIWRLRSSNTRKIGLSVLFSTGLLALVANCYRQYIFVVHNVNWVTPRVNNAAISWIIIEPSLCFIAACLPATHPLVSKLVPTALRRRINPQPQIIRKTSPLRRTSDEEAIRLVSERAATPVSPSEPPRTYGYEAKALRPASTDELEAAVFPSVPLTDWRSVSMGHGVLMKTEVTVTQEDIIEDILGF